MNEIAAAVSIAALLPGVAFLRDTVGGFFFCVFDFLWDDPVVGVAETT